jgi:hypothetical protein
MQRGFKAQVKRDIKTVFHNSDYHSEMTQVRYDGSTYNIPVIFDYDLQRDRKKPSSDNAGGIFNSDLIVYISQYDLETIPRKQTRIEINDDLYLVAKVSCDMGEMRIDLEMMDE